MGWTRHALTIAQPHHRYNELAQNGYHFLRKPVDHVGRQNKTDKNAHRKLRLIIDFIKVNGPSASTDMGRLGSSSRIGALLAAGREYGLIERVGHRMHGKAKVWIYDLPKDKVTP